MLCKVQVGVGYCTLREHFGWTTKAFDKNQYILVRPYDIKTHYTKVYTTWIIFED